MSMVLITGAAGFVGSHVVERALAKGHAVRGVDCLLPDSYDSAVKARVYAELATAHAGAIADGRLELVTADLRNAELDALLDGVDYVINEAGMPGQVKSWQDLGLYTSCNVEALGRLLEASVRAGVERFVQISTSSVYGRFAVGDETQPTRPISPYGVTKLAGEKLVGAYAQGFDLNTVILRYFSIYGPRQRPDMAYHLFSEAMLDGRPIRVFGDGRQSRSNTYVADAAAATVAALARGEAEAYNIAGGQSVQLLEAIEVLEGALGVKAQLEWQPESLGDQRDTMGDASRAMADLEWKPEMSILQGLQAQAEWHRARRP